MDSRKLRMKRFFPRRLSAVAMELVTRYEIFSFFASSSRGVPLGEGPENARSRCVAPPLRRESETERHGSGVRS